MDTDRIISNEVNSFSRHRFFFSFPFCISFYIFFFSKKRFAINLSFSRKYYIKKMNLSLNFSFNFKNTSLSIFIRTYFTNNNLYMYKNAVFFNYLCVLIIFSSSNDARKKTSIWNYKIIKYSTWIFNSSIINYHYIINKLSRSNVAIPIL